MTTQLYHYTDMSCDHHDLLTAEQIRADLTGIRANLDNPTQRAWVDTILAAIDAGCMGVAAEYLACMGINLTVADEVTA